MRHDLEGGWGGLRGVATPLKIRKLKKSNNAKQKTEEMKREKETKRKSRTFI